MKSSAFSLLYGPTLTSICDSWKNHSFDYTDLCRKVMSLLFNTHSFSSKEQASFNFLAIITIRGDFGAQENKICHCFHFPPSICYEVMGLDAIISFLSVVLSQLFHSPLSLLSKGSLVPLRFLPLEWYHLHIRGCYYFFQKS